MKEELIKLKIKNVKYLKKIKEKDISVWMELIHNAIP